MGAHSLRLSQRAWQLPSTQVFAAPQSVFHAHASPAAVPQVPDAQRSPVGHGSPAAQLRRHSPSIHTEPREQSAS
jgi:hypothetical protein